MKASRRGFLGRAATMAVGAGGWVASSAKGARAADFPSHPLTLWVPWPAAGATDITLRLLAELASTALGQPIVTHNRAGASGTLAMPILQQAAADGYTLAQVPQTVFRAPFVQKVSWDPVRDLTPIIQVSGVTFGLLVPAGSEFRSLEDLFAFARTHPGELSIATNGVGTTPHLVLEALFTARGLRYIHVPYKGTSEQINAMAAGQVMAGVNASGFGPAVDIGRLRLLAVFSAQRSRRWPEVPTLRELGHDIVAASPFGLAGPRGLAPAVVETLAQAFKVALFDPRFGAELAKYDQEVAYLGPADYARSCRAIYAAERQAAARLAASGSGHGG